SVTADEIGSFVRGEQTLDRRAVALCFDDAWASVWTTSGPLLRQHGLKAIVYAIPARVSDAAECRPVGVPASGSPFMTWPELRTLQSDGVIDVQSHTNTHARVFTSRIIAGFVEPGYASIPTLNRPRVGWAPLRFVEPEDLGAPLYEHRSRMSDGT